MLTRRPAMPTEPEQSYSVQAAADLLALTACEVRRRIGTGDIRAVDIRRAGAQRALWRILASEIARLQGWSAPAE